MRQDLYGVCLVCMYTCVCVCVCTEGSLCCLMCLALLAPPPHGEIVSPCTCMCMAMSPVWWECWVVPWMFVLIRPQHWVCVCTLALIRMQWFYSPNNSLPVDHIISRDFIAFSSNMRMVVVCSVVIMVALSCGLLQSLSHDREFPMNFPWSCLFLKCSISASSSWYMNAWHMLSCTQINMACFQKWPTVHTWPHIMHLVSYVEHWTSRHQSIWSANAAYGCYGVDKPACKLTSQLCVSYECTSLSQHLSVVQGVAKAQLLL